MRTNPNTVSSHPAKRWFTWKGDTGELEYYDKTLEKNILVPVPFQFVLLDRLSVIRGWHDASESAITSNEVRRTTDVPFTVRAFKMKEILAQGFYGDIKDRIKSVGGRFNINLYIAFEGEEGLTIGSLMLRGAAMSAWIEWENDKKNKPDLFKKGIEISEAKQGKKGSIKFFTPVFGFVSIPKETDDAAGELQETLRSYLQGYLARNKGIPEHDAEPEPEDEVPAGMVDEDGDEIPF